MIKTQDRTPEIYSAESRDFQLIGRLFDASFNNSKVAIDTMLNITGIGRLDYRLVNLARKTIGFNTSNSYPLSELINVLKTFKLMVMNKGSKQAIELAIKTLLNAQHLDEHYYLVMPSVNDVNSKNLVIYLPTSTKHISLLDEIFNYILPAGWTYSIALVGAPSVETRGTSITSKSTIRTLHISDMSSNNPNYISIDGGELQIESMDYIGQVPLADSKFISPTVGMSVIMSDEEQAEDRKDPKHE